MSAEPEKNGFKKEAVKYGSMVAGVIVILQLVFGFVTSITDGKQEVVVHPQAEMITIMRDQTALMAKMAGTMEELKVITKNMAEGQESIAGTLKKQHLELSTVTEQLNKAVNRQVTKEDYEELKKKINKLGGG